MKSTEIEVIFIELVLKYSLERASVYLGLSVILIPDLVAIARKIVKIGRQLNAVSVVQKRIIGKAASMSLAQKVTWLVTLLDVGAMNIEKSHPD